MNRLVCSICGEELKAKDNFCPSCGASVKGEKHTEDKETTIDNLNEKESKEKKKNQKKSITRSNVEKGQPELKKLPVFKLVYLVFGLIVLVLLINYTAGIFEQPIASNVVSNNNFNDVHQGVDLQNLQRINSLEEKVKNEPGDKTSLLELAHLLNDSGFKERAIEKYKQYLKIDPKDANVLVDMGVCYYELKNYDEAIRQMKEALKYQPKHQIAHLNLGIVNMTAGNHDEALDWLKKAVEIDPSTNIAKRAQELINSH